MKARCPYCKKLFETKIGYINQAKKRNAPLYCGRKCAGLGRRKTVEEKKRIKAEYDIAYRQNNLKRIKKQKAAFFKIDYAAKPEKYKAWRKKRQKYHNEYMRTKWKDKKADYDKIRQAKKQYGEFWEAAIALHKLGRIVDNRRAKQEQKTINKTQNRKRYANKNTKRKELESCVMGLYQPS